MEQQKSRILLKKFFVALATTVTLGICLVLAAVILDKNGIITVDSWITGGKEGNGLISAIFPDVDRSTNFIILGTDEGGSRTDVMIAGHFNSKTCAIDLISIPRDTQVTMPEERRNTLKEAKRRTPSSGVMKINEVHHYAGKEYGIDFSVKQAEELLGVSFDYYALVDLEAFRYIVESIGGVEFDVPFNMDYDDPEQDLHIHLTQGLQTLNGKQAEGFVRWRKNNSGGGYPNGDVGRTAAQQDFIKAVVKKALSSDDFVSTISMSITTYMNYVKTNFNPVTDTPKYIKYIKDLQTENIVSHTLPGKAQTINGISYYIADKAAVSSLVDDVFFNDDEVIEEISSIGKNIQVLNGAGKSGIAGRNKERLTELGYTITDIGDYSGTRANQTRIYVRIKGMGSDLKELYEGSEIVVDVTMDDKYDIVVVLGKNEQ